jgi:threonylcarbamoyladenosine tRNA methylthiotransferase MtaB
MARQPKFCPHFHLPLQSGCDRTLARMGRRYTAADFHGAVAHIRQLFDNPALSADIIAGFPGEDEAEFAESLCFVQSLDLADAHVFPFSPRETTPAAQMDGQLSAAVKNERARSLTETVSESRKRFLKSQLGRAEPVLFQRGGGGYAITGRGPLQ